MSITRRSALRGMAVGTAYALVSAQELAGASRSPSAAEGFPSEEAQMNIATNQSQFEISTRAINDSSKLVRLEEKFNTAHARWEAASERFSEAQSRVLAERPSYQATPTPAHLLKLQGDMTIKEFGDMSHPVNVELAKIRAGDEVRRDACVAELGRLERKYGADVAEAEDERLLRAADRIAKRIMDAPVATMADLEIKIRVQEKSHYCEPEDFADVLVADIRRIRQQYG